MKILLSLALTGIAVFCFGILTEVQNLHIVEVIALLLIMITSGLTIIGINMKETRG